MNDNDNKEFQENLAKLKRLYLEAVENNDEITIAQIEDALETALSIGAARFKPLNQQAKNELDAIKAYLKERENP